MNLQKHLQISELKSVKKKTSVNLHDDLQITVSTLFFDHDFLKK
jgi:hypothetical protein